MLTAGNIINSSRSLGQPDTCFYAFLPLHNIPEISELLCQSSLLSFYILSHFSISNVNMSIAIIDPIFTTPYIGPCQITLFKTNNMAVDAIDGPAQGEPVLKINDVNITIKMSEGCKAVKTNGVMPEGYYIKVSHKGERYGWIIR